MKTKRYWLRGVVIITLVYLVLFFVTISRVMTLFLGWFGFPGSFSECILQVSGTVQSGICPFSLELSGQFSVLMQGVIGYAILGAVLGWFYGKIKNRNKTPQV